MKPSLRFAILQRDNFKCRYCGHSGMETELEVDHINPRANGGKDDEANLVTSCKPCNRGKSTKVLDLSPTDTLTMTRSDPLVGYWFHSFASCEGCGEPRVSWQGHVVAILPSGTYVVQLFEWVVGCPSDKRLVRPEQIERENWCFYDDSESMRNAWDITLQRHHKECVAVAVPS